MKANPFRRYVDSQTVGKNESEKKAFKIEFAEKIGRTFFVIADWYSGRTVPKNDVKIAINAVAGKQIYKIKQI